MFSLGTRARWMRPMSRYNRSTRWREFWLDEPEPHPMCRCFPVVTYGA